MKNYVCLVLLIYLVGSITLALGIKCTFVSVNPLELSNVTKIDHCEKEIEYFLYGWGITGIVLGSIVIILGVIQTFLFTRKIVEDSMLIWMFNVSLALAFGFFYTFSSFVSGFMLFKHCTYHLRAYYQIVTYIVFGVSVTLLSIFFIVSFVLLCKSRHPDVEFHTFPQEEI